MVHGRPLDTDFAGIASCLEKLRVISSNIASDTPRLQCLPQILIVVLSCLWLLPASAAPKTDIVIFKNGDKLTGEVKSLRRGRLNLNTDATGTIGIEWDKISGVVSKQRIQVETSNGTRYFGQLTILEEEPGLTVVSADGPVTLDTQRVILMEPIEERGIHALDVDVSVGYNFAKAGGVTTGSLGLGLDYRTLLRIESLTFDTTLTDSDTQEANKRLNLRLQHTRLWKNRWFSNGTLSFDQNDELGLELRTSLGAGTGRYLIQSNSMLWSLEGGLQVSRENQISEVEDTDSVEAPLSAQFDWFLFQDPEFDWSTELQLIPSVTERGRVRAEFNTSLKWELINDLKWGLSLYASFDNQPQSQLGATSDYGIDTTITYEF